MLELEEEEKEKREREYGGESFQPFVPTEWPKSVPDLHRQCTLCGHNEYLMATATRN